MMWLSRCTMESTLSLRREIAVYICSFASSSLSRRNSGWCSRSRNISNTASKSPLQEVVHLIAGLRLAAAGAPDLAIEIGEPGLVRRFGDRAAADARRRVDQRQLMVFLKKDH